MNMLAPIGQFSAYRQLRADERFFVDGYVHHLEERATARNERISAALMRAPEPEIMAACGGMLERVLVRSAIHERIVEIAAITEFTPRRVIREFGLLAFSNMGDYVAEGLNGPTIELEGLTRDQWAPISEVKVEEHTGREGAFTKKTTIKTHSKISALENIAKLMGMYEPGNQHCAAEFARPIDAVSIDKDMSVNEISEAYSIIRDIS